jgi:hypothetical protein
MVTHSLLPRVSTVSGSSAGGLQTPGSDPTPQPWGALL